MKDKNYIRFEVENHMPWARNHLVGVYVDGKGNEKKDRLMCFNSCVSREKNNELIKGLCDSYNESLLWNGPNAY